MAIKKLPKEVSSIIKALQKAGYEAYAVGGCVRDLIIDRKPKDWDITTNALPEDIQRVFQESVYENDFGTVMVKTGSEDKILAIIEVTTYRQDVGYSDKRHPDKVNFTSKLEDDLARRDFTINAIALDGDRIIDPFNGQKDIENKLISTVGDPKERFGEDALRILRAIRFAVLLEFKITSKILLVISFFTSNLLVISAERIRDELFKIIMSDNPAEGIELMRKTGVLPYVLPELAKGVDVAQNKHHIYSIYEHSIKSLQITADKKYSLPVRLAALFHDIAKTQTKRGDGPDATFYNHDIVGAKVATKFLERMNVSRELINQVSHLIRNHMFYYNVDEVSEAGVRRLLKRAGGVDKFKDLLSLRIADRLGSGVPKAMPYKLRHLQYLIEKVSSDPISVGMLKVRGDDIMKILDIEPGPKIGLILNALLAEVLEDPKLNIKDYLTKRVGELAKKTNEELRSAVSVIEEKKEEVDLGVKKKHYIK
ncbi:MAG: hypothetical protein COU81_00310 [Candidatus Portnoybacteria bacterium CG10_big_fil_rev_8_21_14_0_10_36_7]|uniref:HD domain-containing protein n=1 Tax=Candidatus Portnoybacteria bacterium CG10_big_fil_rev_8_21_14_0_10_36_7 TaxID=1974812 RepID=A0A2M8KF05_9BACT|nr:MAG: hypothetical protein COU81_00310 [Candidatus Portnoybacteria bacterium CG10_big_fil_rev_8_21_14_0_10_36_7]